MDEERRGGLKRGVDPAVAAWQKRAAENRAALTAKQRADRQRVRVKYDLDEGLKAAVAAIGTREHTSASQAAQLLLGWAVTRYAAEEPELREAFHAGKERSRTPKFDWNVELDPAWFSVFERISGNGDI